MRNRRVLSVLAGIAGGVIMAIAVTAVFRSRTVSPLSWEALALAVMLGALMQIAGRTERWNFSGTLVQIVMGLTSLGISLLFAGVVSRNAQAFNTFALTAAETHAAALALVLILRRLTGNKG